MSDHQKHQNQQSQQHQETKGTRLTGSFTVEFGDSFGRRITLHTLKKRYRGAWSIAQMASRKDDVTGKRIGGRDLGEGMSQMPPVPGIRIEVDLGKNYFREYDPLSEDDELLRQCCSTYGRGRSVSEYKARAWPTVETKAADHHLFKTLVEELCQMVEGGQAKLVDGTLPKKGEVDAMPGRYLTNNWSSASRVPKFRDELAAYQDKIEAAALM